MILFDFNIRLGVALACGLGIGVPLHGAEKKPAAATPRELFADQPKGLSEKVFAWKFMYVAEVFGALSGGLKQGAVYDGYVKIGAGLNLGKAIGWQGASLYANILYPHGESLTANYVGDLNVVSNIDTYDSVRLFKCFFQQNLFENRFSLRVGIMAVDKEFFVSDNGALFIHSAFGAFPIISQNFNAPVYPVSAPGARLRWEPTPALSFRAAIFSGDVGTPENNRHHTRFRARKRDGVAAFAEAAYKLNADESGLRGTYKIGGFYNSKDFDDPHGGDKHHGDFGGYVIADQQLYREGSGEDDARQGLSAFARFGWVPEGRNFVAHTIDGGLTYAGLLPDRDRDFLGIGITYSKLSMDLRDEAGAPLPSHHEAALELNYLAVINDNVSVQPDFQYIFNPGGVEDASDAIVADLRINISF